MTVRGGNTTRRDGELTLARARATVEWREERLAKAMEQLRYFEGRAAKFRARKARHAERALKMARLLVDGWTAKDVGREFGLHPLYVSTVVKSAARRVVKRPEEVKCRVRRCAAILLERSAL